MATATKAKKTEKPKKEKKAELPGMPEPDALGKAGIEYLARDEEFKKAQEARDEAKDVLVMAFQEAKKNSISIEGRVLSYSHAETDSIVIKRAKEA